MDPNAFSENGNFLILAFDHRDNFKKFINPEFPEEVTDQETIESIKNIIKSLKSGFSGILLDEQYSLSAYKELQVEKSFLLPIENSEFEIIDEEKISVISKDSIDIKNSDAEGVKLLIHFDPSSKNVEKKLIDVQRTIQDAHENNLPLFLGIISDNMQDPERVLNSVEYLVEKNVLPDVFAVEFPGSDYLCQKLTNTLGRTPWLLITGAANYTLYQEQLRMACENGCRGFLAGRSLWQEYFEIKDTIIKEQFLQKILPLRFEKIRDIVLKS